MTNKKWGYFFLTLTAILGEISVYCLWETNNRWYMLPVLLATIAGITQIYYLGQNSPSTPITYVRQEYKLNFLDGKLDGNDSLHNRLYRRM